MSGIRTSNSLKGEVLRRAQATVSLLRNRCLVMCIKAQRGIQATVPVQFQSVSNSFESHRSSRHFLEELQSILSGVLTAGRILNVESLTCEAPLFHRVKNASHMSLIGAVTTGDRKRCVSHRSICKNQAITKADAEKDDTLQAEVGKESAAR